MKIKLNLKYSKQLNEDVAVSAISSTEPLENINIDLSEITNKLTKDATFNNIIARFKLSRSLLDNLTLMQLPSNYNALLTTTNMPKKFLNINLSYDNDPVKTINKAEDYSMRFFEDLDFNIDEFFSAVNESYVNEALYDHGVNLWDNTRELKRKHTLSDLESDEQQIGTKKFQSASASNAIDLYIDKMNASISNLLAIFAPNGNNALGIKDFKKAVNTILRVKNKEVFDSYIKILDKNYTELENAKLNKAELRATKAERLQSATMQIIRHLGSNPDLAEKLKNKSFALKIANATNADNLDKILKSLNLPDTDELSANESLNYDILNEEDNIALNNDVELDLDEIYATYVGILKAAIEPLFEEDRDNLQAVKEAKTKMENLLKARNQEIENSISIICRTGAGAKEIPGLTQQAKTFLKSHPLRAERLKNIWANHSTDLQSRMEHRLNTIKNSEIMLLAEDLITNQLPRIFAMMFTYKLVATIIENSRAKMSNVNSLKLKEIEETVNNCKDNIYTTIQILLTAYSNEFLTIDSLLYTDEITGTFEETDIPLKKYNDSAKINYSGSIGYFISKIMPLRTIPNITSFISKIEEICHNLPSNYNTLVLLAQLLVDNKLITTDTQYIDLYTTYIQPRVPEKLNTLRAMLDKINILNYSDKDINNVKKLLKYIYAKKDKFDATEKITSEMITDEISNISVEADTLFEDNLLFGDVKKLFSYSADEDFVKLIYESMLPFYNAKMFTRTAYGIDSVCDDMISILNFIANPDNLSLSDAILDDSVLRDFLNVIYENTNKNKIAINNKNNIINAINNFTLSETKLLLLKKDEQSKKVWKIVYNALNDLNSIYAQYDGENKNSIQQPENVINEIKTLYKIENKQITTNLKGLADIICNSNEPANILQKEEYNQKLQTAVSELKNLISIIPEVVNKDAKQLSELKARVEEMYYNEKYTLGLSQNERVSIKIFAKNYQESGEEYAKYASNNENPDIDGENPDLEFEKFCNNAISLKKEADKVFKEKIEGFSKETPNVLKMFNDIQTFNEFINKDSLNNVINEAKSTNEDLTDLLIYTFLDKFFTYLNVDNKDGIKQNKVINDYFEHFMYALTK